MLDPLSGPKASAGLDEKHVYELLADMVNGKGPLIARPFYQQLEGLRATDLPVPGTGVTCDATGQNAGVRAIIGQLQGGKYWTVWPFEMAAHARRPSSHPEVVRPEVGRPPGFRA